MLFFTLGLAFLPQPRGPCVGAGAGSSAMRTAAQVMQYEGNDYRPAGGGRGSDREYQRESGDSAPVDEARVKTLLTERSQLRRAMDYDGADAVRTQLNNMGVSVRDKDQTWRVGRGGGGGAGRGRGGGRGGGSFGRGGGGGYGRGSQGRGYNDGSVGFFDEPRRPRGGYDDSGGADYGRGYGGGGGGYDRGYGGGGGGGGYDRGYGGGGGGGGYDRGYGGGGGGYDRGYGGGGGGGGYDRGGGGGGRRRDSYEREPSDTAEVDVARVETLLAERTQLRAARDFDGADAVRDELREMDVTVHDREMRWFVGDLRDLDNGRGRGGGRDDGYGREQRAPRRERTGRPFDPADFGPLGHDYVAANDAAGELDEETATKVNAMIAERLAAKVTRDFTRADGLRDELRGMGVNVDDRTKEWVYAPVEEIDFGPTGHDYTRSADDAAELDEAAVGAVNELLAQRLRAKMARRFGEADEVLAKLLDEMGVEVDDKHKAWRADGAPFPSHVRIAGDGDEAALASGLDADKVGAMITERAAAKRQRDYETADAVATSLRDDFGVVLDDKRGTWRAVKMAGGYYQVGPSLDDDELTERVRALIARRTEHQVAREYDEADALHAELAELNISLDTRSRSWRLDTRNSLPRRY